MNMLHKRFQERLDAALKAGQRPYMSAAQIKDQAKRLRRVCDSIPEMSMFRGDVEEGIFAKQLVTVTLAELFRFEYPETKWVNDGLITISTNIDEGAKEFGYVEMDHAGRAEIVADNATDIPSADIAGRNNLRAVHTVADYITYSTQDIRTARLQGLFDVATEKAVSAREAMDRRLNQLIRTGQEDVGLRGITNAPGITVQTAVTGNWASATSAQIRDDFAFAATEAMDDTDGVEMPDTALFSVANWNRISTLPFDSASGPLTTLEYMQKAFPQIRRWDWEHGLKEADQAGTGNAVMIYRNEPTRCRAIFPMMMRAMPPEQSGLSFKLVFETRFGGVIVPKPRSVVRLDGT